MRLVSQCCRSSSSIVCGNRQGIQKGLVCLLQVHNSTQMKLWHCNWIADSVLFTGWIQWCSHHLQCFHCFLWWSQMLKSKIHSSSGAQSKPKIQERFVIYKNKKKKLKCHVNNSLQTVVGRSGAVRWFYIFIETICDQTEVDLTFKVHT